jgi:hypothetical protein
MTLTTENNDVNSGIFTCFDSVRKVVKLCGHTVEFKYRFSNVLHEIMSQIYFHICHDFELDKLQCRTCT